MRKPIDIKDLFFEVYKAYPSSSIGRNDINFSNNIILPQKALSQLLSMKKYENNAEVFLFCIINSELNIYTHCGVSEFTAKEECCYIPSNLFERLQLEEGQKVILRDKTLKNGTYIKVKPHEADFINIPEHEIILEENLRNFFCVTEGDIISIKYEDKIYKFDILKCKPNKAIKIINCDLKLDFVTS